jgi:hypothetical protein
MGTNYNPRIVTSGLVLALDAANPKSYPGSGTTCSDLSNTNSNGTLTNGTTYSSTVMGVFNFDGTNDLISFPHNAAQNPASITISSWVKPLSSLKTGNIVGKDGNLGYRYRVGSAGEVQLLDRGATNIISTAGGLISADNWYNILVTGNPAGLQIFINGIFIVSNATAFGGNTRTTDLVIGAEDGAVSFAESFKGSIAQVSIYNRVLTALEIQQNFNATRRRYGI